MLQMSGAYCQNKPLNEGRGGLVVNTLESGVEPHSGSHAVYFSKTYLPPPPPQSTGNTPEAVASSQYDRKIVYRDVKHKSKQNR